MRKVSLIAVALFALAASSAPVNLDQGTIYTITGCSSTGSSSTAVVEGAYFVTATAADTYECLSDASGTGCASGGTIIPSGTSFLQSIGRGGKYVSCRSAGSAGQLQFTHAPGQ